MVEDIIVLVQQLEWRVKSVCNPNINVKLLLSLLRMFKKTLLNSDAEDPTKLGTCDQPDLPTEQCSVELHMAETNMSDTTASNNDTQGQKSFMHQISAPDECGNMSVERITPVESDSQSSQLAGSSSFFDQDCLSEMAPPVVSQLICKLCTISKKVDKQEENITYADWTLLSDHIEEKHVVFSSSSKLYAAITSEDSKLTQKHKMKNSLLCCPHCFVKKSTKDSYKDAYTKLCFHMQEKHMETIPDYLEVFECTLCCYKTYSSRLLASHSDYNHSTISSAKSQKVMCTICHKLVLQRYMSKHLLVKHEIGADNPKLNTDDSVEVISCADCGKHIRGRRNFDTHVMRMHLKVKDYLCHSCSQSFFDKKSLSIHMYQKHAVNLDSKPILQCMEKGCDFTAISNDILTRHAQTRHTSCQYLCTICGKSFKTIHNLKQHEQTMHPDPSGKVYNCPHCSFSSQVKQYVTRHVKVHDTDKKHRCDFAGCSYATHFSENLTKHKKTHVDKKPSSKPPRRSSKRPPASTELSVSNKVIKQVYETTPGLMSNAQLYMGQNHALNSINADINPHLPSICTSITGSAISSSLPSSSNCLLVQSCDYSTSNPTLPTDAIEAKPNNMLTVGMPNTGQCLHTTPTLDNVSGDITHTLLNMTDTDVSSTCPYPHNDQLVCANSTRQALYQGITENSQPNMAAPDNPTTQYLSL